MNALQELEALADALHHLTGKDYARYVQLWLCAEPDERREIQALLELERRRVAPGHPVVLAPPAADASGGELIDYLEATRQQPGVAPGASLWASWERDAARLLLPED